MAKTSWFPEAKQVICSRSLVTDVISTASTKIWPSGVLAFYFLQIWLDRQELPSRFWLQITQVWLISTSLPPRLLHLAVCITPPKFKFGQQSRGWVEIRRDDACQFKPNTAQNILFKAALISHFILTRNQMAARCLMWKGSCSDNPTLLSPDSALPPSSLYHLSAHYSGFIITFLFWFMITLFIKPVSSSRRWLFLAWKLGLKATAHYLFNTKQQS